MGPCDLEFITISISSPHSSHKHCISLLYRPPSLPAATFDDIFAVVHQINPFSFSGFVLIGDFNIDFYNPSHPLFSRLNSFLYSFSLTDYTITHSHQAKWRTISYWPISTLWYITTYWLLHHSPTCKLRPQGAPNPAKVETHPKSHKTTTA